MLKVGDIVECFSDIGIVVEARKNFMAVKPISGGFRQYCWRDDGAIPFAANPGLWAKIAEIDPPDQGVL